MKSSGNGQAAMGSEPRTNSTKQAAAGKNVFIGIVDTMFSRVDMGAIAMDELGKNYKDVKIIRRTVPGIKDLAVECKRLLELEKCDICMALGMAGGAPVDMQCAHEASLGIQQAKLLTNRHIVEVFVHENEAWNERELLNIFEQRIRKHAHNAVLLAGRPEELIKYAGKGVRQGKEDEGRLNADRQIGIGFVISEFNTEITERMEAAAEKTAWEFGAEIIETIRVPGAFDSPLPIKKLLMGKSVDCVAVLGAVIKGETKHDEAIVFNIANRLIRLSLEFDKPVTLGVIGPAAAWEQAEARAEQYAVHATETAIRMAKLLRR